LKIYTNVKVFLCRDFIIYGCIMSRKSKLLCFTLKRQLIVLSSRRTVYQTISRIILKIFLRSYWAPINTWVPFSIQTIENFTSDTYLINWLDKLTGTFLNFLDTFQFLTNIFGFPKLNYFCKFITSSTYYTILLSQSTAWFTRLMTRLTDVWCFTPQL